MEDYGSKKTGTYSFRGKMLYAFLFFVAVLFAFLFCRIPVKAAEEDEPSRAIAIVFDNSGSMYASAAWCDALYSMEVFAAMAEPGDEIGIYPLNPIELDGITYTRDDPLILWGGDDVSVIRDIYTPSSLDTHIETISGAYNGLLTMAGEEKWLIILSGGDIYYENGEPLDSLYGTDRSGTQERLDTLLSDYNDSVNVVYLAIGEEATVPTIDGAMYSEVVVANYAAEAPGDAIGISNTIYGREGMSAASGTLEIEQPLSNLVLYVQGADIENLRLTDAEGNEAGILQSSTSLLYAEAPGSGSVAVNREYYADNADDPSLAGEIVTYGEIPEGTYMVRYDGTAASTGVYYKFDGSAPVIAEDEEESAADTEAEIEEEELIRDEEEIDREAEAEAEAETVRSETGRRAHPVRFRVLLVLLFIAIAVVIVFVVFAFQKVLPNRLRAKIDTFTINGKDARDGKKPYVRYSGGGRRSGKIIIGPRPGMTDFDFRLTLNLEACSRRMKKSGDRGAVIESLPTKIGNLTSYTIDAGTDKYTFTKDGGDKPRGDRSMYLGRKFTYSMKGYAKDDTLTDYEPDNEEDVEMVIEVEFR